MKTRLIILEILLVIIPVFSACVIVRYELNEGKSLEDIFSILCMYLPASVGYWVTKNKIQSSNHPNPEKPIRIWQYLMLGFYVSCIIFFILLAQNIVEKSVKNIGFLWLFWMIIYGNFRSNIEPFYNDLHGIFTDDEDIQKQTKRFSGKLLVLGGILSIILLLILPETLIVYVLLTYIFSFFIIPFVYGKIIQRRKLV